MSFEVAIFKAALVYGSPLLISYILYYAYPPVGEPLLYALLTVFLPIFSEIYSLFAGGF